MPILAAIVGPSSGGRFIPVKPILSHYAANQFKIDNYDSSYIYGLSVGTRSNDIITISSASSPSIITAKSPKGVVDSSVSTCEWRTITTYQSPIYGYGQVGWDYPWCTSGCNGGPCSRWPNGDPFCQVPVYGNGAVVGYSTVENSPPSGFTKAFSQWAGVT